MSKAKSKTSMRQVEELMAKKSGILSKAQAFATMGLLETAQPLWASAASHEERIASLLDAHGDSLEAAVHRISAASCYQKAGDPSRATNLYRAALAGPLREVTRNEVEEMLAECLTLLLKKPSSISANVSADQDKTLE
jgi:hypothetical protein